jgi:hypothetical protein
VVFPLPVSPTFARVSWVLGDGLICLEAYDDGDGVSFNRIEERVFDLRDWKKRRRLV